MGPSTHQRPNDALELEVVAGDERAQVVRRAARETLAAVGVAEGHIALALVSAEEIRRLNREHRGLDRATDVLSFPIDGGGQAAGPRELGDVAICAEQADDLVRVAVHGVLHLLGFDHEADDGEMLALEDRIVDALR